MVLAVIARCFHLEFVGLLFAGRVLSLICFVLLGATAYFGAVRCGYEGWVAATPAILLVSDYSFSGWNATVRPDMAGLLLSALCIVLTLVPTRRAVFAAALCAAVAVSLKLTYVAAPVSVVIWLLWSRRHSYALWFCVISGVAVLVIAASFMVRGDPVLSQVLIMRNVAASFGGFVFLNQQEWRQDSTKFLFAICFTGLWYGAKKREEPQGILVGLYLVLTWLIAVTTSFNSGADNNYYLEPRVACALVVPFGVSALQPFWRRIAPVRAFMNAVVVLAFVIQPIMWIRTIVKATRDQSTTKGIARIVSGRNILSTDSYFAALSSEPEMLDPYLVTQLEKRAYWSSDPIVRKVNAQQYDFVIFRTPQGKIRPYHDEFFFDRALMSAIQQNYVPVCTSSKHLVLLPINRPSGTSAADLEEAGCRQAIGALDKYIQ
ncbi:MAG: hypothetical protein DMG88_21690 [Acidobacteria bacterium]|nr:MAG: hypothetical protein DMG88_21690 [Acidobacteriota bacterium]